MGGLQYHEHEHSIADVNVYESNSKNYLPLINIVESFELHIREGYKSISR